MKRTDQKLDNFERKIKDKSNERTAKVIGKLLGLVWQIYNYWQI